jgi:excisionase family DNA binding protein
MASEVTVGGVRGTVLLLDVHATAGALGIGERTLARLTAAGEIPHVRIGRRVLYSPADLERWIQDRRAGPQPAAKQSEDGTRLCATPVL